MAFQQTGTTAETATADGTATYLLTINAPTGGTIGDGATTFPDGTTQGSQLVYQVTVDTSGANAGTIIGMQSANPGQATPPAFSEPTPSPLPFTGSPSTFTATAVNFPTLTDGNGSTVTLPASWTAGTPTWSQISTTVATSFSDPLSMAVYDSLGVQQTFPVTWTAAGNNSWLMTVGTPTNPAGTATTGVLQDATGNTVSSYSYNVTFNSDGSLGSITALPDEGGWHRADIADGVAPVVGSLERWRLAQYGRWGFGDYRRSGDGG